jgi:hypothetical protein
MFSVAKPDRAWICPNDPKVENPELPISIQLVDKVDDLHEPIR